MARSKHYKLKCVNEDFQVNVIIKQIFFRLNK